MTLFGNNIMKKIKGNLITLAKEGHFDVIIHGCNCFHTMNSGIAKSIREEWPQAYTADVNTFEKGDESKLGKISMCGVNDESLLIFNAYTQYRFGRDKRHVDYGALRNAFGIISVSLRHFDMTELRIGYPKIGAGLGGGDWCKIEVIIDEALEGLDHTLVEFD